MSLIKKIKADQLQARKNRDTIAKPLLTTLLGDAEAIGKNDGGRGTTDGEVELLVKSFLKKLNETIIAIEDREGDTTIFEAEKVILNGYLPQQMSIDDLTSEIVAFVVELDDQSMKSMGKVMNHLKLNFPNKFDNKLASTIIRAELC